MICLDDTVLIDIQVTVLASHANDIEIESFSVLQYLKISCIPEAGSLAALTGVLEVIFFQPFFFVNFRSFMIIDNKQEN